MHTEFGDSRLAVPEIWLRASESGSCDPDHAPFRGGLSSVC